MSFPEAFNNSSFIITLAVFLAAALVIAFVALKDRRPRESLSPSMIPTIPVMLVSGIVAMLSLVHLLNLLGLHTGR
jgi:thiamine transporter ThiT